MFAGAHQFQVVGGTFTSITQNHFNTPIVPSDFEMIPMGDIDLQHKIRLNYDSGVVERMRVCRVYSARLHPQNTTVMMYQGRGAEEEWRQDIIKYMSIRHPNILQMRGAARSGGIHATLFHNGAVVFILLFIELNG
ncbi:hypothetical protein MVEN_00012300 [Mycena venus]|uniref:Protein kinase domain-containing protein n=1 Tax=Mycena venus TaxID=2733690 RepID=A0A8H6Z9B7_9AGAR|nr:hypothetical protein MVEN_00012300 [Mycena venus]